MARLIGASVLLAATTISWSLLVVFDGPWAVDSASLIGATQVVLAAIAVSGVLVASSRWGRWLSVAVGVCGPLLGIAVPVGPWWIVNLVASAVVVTAFAGTVTSGAIRRLPRADGPTPRVVGFMLGLTSVPLLIGVVSPEGLGAPEWTVAAVSTLAALLYSQATDFSVLVVRILVPAASILAALLAGWPRAWIWLAVGAGVTIAAWHRDIRLAVHPLIDRSRAVTILPEFVPSDVLEAAGLDEHGNRKRET